jgi:hypothetical protein
MLIKCKQSVSQLELGVQPQNGNLLSIVPEAGVQLHYENKSGQLYWGDSLVWLQGLETDSVDLIFAGSAIQYRES